MTCLLFLALAAPVKASPILLANLRAYLGSPAGVKIISQTPAIEVLQRLDPQSPLHVEVINDMTSRLGSAPTAVGETPAQTQVRTLVEGIAAALQDRRLENSVNTDSEDVSTQLQRVQAAVWASTMKKRSAIPPRRRSLIAPSFFNEAPASLPIARKDFALLHEFLQQTPLSTYFWQGKNTLATRVIDRLTTARNNMMVWTKAPWGAPFQDPLPEGMRPLLGDLIAQVKHLRSVASNKNEFRHGMEVLLAELDQAVDHRDPSRLIKKLRHLRTPLRPIRNRP